MQSDHYFFLISNTWKSYVHVPFLHWSKDNLVLFVD